jgi:putative transposase
LAPIGTVPSKWPRIALPPKEGDELQAVVRAAASRLVLLCWLIYIPWLNPIEMLWRHFRREVTIASRLRT